MQTIAITAPYPAGVLLPAIGKPAQLTQAQREETLRFLQSRSVCLLVGEEDGESQAFYKRCGYQLRGAYDTIFLE